MNPLPVGEVLALLEAGIGDGRLDDGEKRALSQALQEGHLREEDRRRVRNQAFDLVRQRLGAPEQLALLKWLEGVVRALDGARTPAGASEAWFSPGPDCLGAIRRCLRQTRERADICVFTLSDDRIAEEVLTAHRRGVAFRVVTDNDKESDAGSDIARLREAGIPVAVDRTAAHMHHKFAIFDGVRLLNGSYNWTRSACDVNEENLVLSSDPALLSRFSARFEALWSALAGKPSQRTEDRIR
ncbi:MAG TPA: phospholipase D-like domain-containing protein [Rhodocyclaceae bacterium]|nr:phospholipase D-like domain-containing protein [Rhodocyclaceae bacterium]